MQRSLIIGVGAGLAAAALYFTVISYSLLAVILLYMAPLPLFIVGFGWGSAAALVGAIAGTAVIWLTTDYRSALLFVVTVALAPAILSYLALLSRDTSEASDSEGAPLVAGRQFYPEGRLVLWTAALAGLIATTAVILLGPDAESFRAVLREAVTRMFSTQPGLQEQLKTTGDLNLDGFIEMFVWMLPAVSALLWMLSSLINLFLAVRIVALSGRALRPWAPFSSLAFPRSMAIAPFAAMAASFVPGTVGLLGNIFLAVSLAAFAVLGLAVIHSKTLGFTSRPLLLGALYAALLIFNWIVLLALSGVGLANTLAGRPGPSNGPIIRR
ncbi:hypothetical protein FHS85_002709 [Rhodoligotrophos appendicifer]|uniref:DUF2232 domain-containing protein n=1 Tax=Rhodoligotrophos appendicifer TaxID=987056 RepID=UPI001186D760|nr:DUF2232 domain-containing protein [Rhodoligotrophos appendicifer]